MEHQVQAQAPKEAIGYRLVLPRRLASEAEAAPDNLLIVPVAPQFWTLNPFRVPDDLRLQDGQLYRIIWVDAQGMPVAPKSYRYVPALRFLLGPPDLDSMTDQDEYESILELVDHPQLRPRYEKEIADLRIDRLRQQHHDEAEQRMQARILESHREMTRLNEETQRQTALEDQRRAERQREEQAQRAREQQAAAPAALVTHQKREQWLAIGVPLLMMAAAVLIPKIQEWLGSDFFQALGRNIEGILPASTSQQNPPPMQSRSTPQKLSTAPVQPEPQALPSLSQAEKEEVLEVLNDRARLQFILQHLARITSPNKTTQLPFEETALPEAERYKVRAVLQDPRKVVFIAQSLKAFFETPGAEKEDGKGQEIVLSSASHLSTATSRLSTDATAALQSIVTDPTKLFTLLHEIARAQGLPPPPIPLPPEATQLDPADKRRIVELARNPDTIRLLDQVMKERAAHRRE